MIACTCLCGAREGASTAAPGKKVWETLELPCQHAVVVVSQAWSLPLHFSMLQTCVH